MAGPSNFHLALEGSITHWCIGRYWCPACRVIAPVVRDVLVEVVLCGCGAVCVVAEGYDDLEDDPPPPGC